MRKKIFALAVILAMLLTMIPVFTVSADDYAHADIVMQYSVDGVTWTTITGDECFLRSGAYQQDLNVGNNVFTYTSSLPELRPAGEFPPN